LYRVYLTDAQRDELTRRTRAPELKRRTRDRLEYVRLAASGWSIPKIATLFRAEEDTVRYWVKRFLALGFDALEDQPHPGQTSRLTPALLAAVRARLAEQDRTWTRQQLADWLADTHGLRLSADHLGFLLRRAGITCHRTERSLQHAQDPAQVAERAADLGTVEQGGRPAAWTSAT
jgi:transposase